MKQTNQPSMMREVLAVAIAGFVLCPIAARTQDQSELIQKLLQRFEQLEKKVTALEAGQKPAATFPASIDTNSVAIQGLEQQMRVLQPDRVLDAQADATKATEAVRISIGAAGFAISSADTNFVLKLKGLLQVDSRTFFDDSQYLDGNEGFYLRRACLILEGTVYRDFDYHFTPDFGGNSVQTFDAWINYRYRPELQLRVGKFKSPVGFEKLQADATLPFNERSLVSNFVPIRSLGAQLWGDITVGVVSYAAEVFNPVGDGRNPSNNEFSDNPGVAGRLAFQPLKHTAGPGRELVLVQPVAMRILIPTLSPCPARPGVHCRVASRPGCNSFSPIIQPWARWWRMVSTGGFRPMPITLRDRLGFWENTSR